MPLQRKQISKEKAIERLTTLCVNAEQCEFDMNRKMLNWGLSAPDRKDILEYLIENNYLNDARFARSFTRDKARFSNWGPIKIKMELIKKRIKSNFIADALHSVEPEIWKDALLKCVKSKSKDLDLIGENSWENRQKLYKFLIWRGFSSNMSAKAVDRMKKFQQEGK